MMMNDEEMVHCLLPERQLERVVSIMRRLRAPGGCPWDAEQCHESIVSNLIEECYECIDAIREGDAVHLREELGDVLLQVVFHADMAQDFDINDVSRVLADKLVRRHPHVFACSEAGDSDAVLSLWDSIKRKEQDIEDKPYLQNCGKGLPSLLRAFKVTKKVSKVGFDWPDVSGAVDKLREELAEFEACSSLPDDAPEVADELGDVLFSAVNLCRKRGVDPELALSAATNKFERRFACVEGALRAKGVSLADASLVEMEQAWQEAKLLEGV